MSDSRSADSSTTADAEHVQQTTLVNLHDDKCSRRIDRQTKFGNPFRLKEDGGEYTRRESIKRYRLYFAYRIGTEPGFRKDVLELTGEKLGCWCAPKPCHGDVILEYIEKEASE